jgi:hypothetical protein
VEEDIRASPEEDTPVEAGIPAAAATRAEAADTDSLSFDFLIVSPKRRRAYTEVYMARRASHLICGQKQLVIESFESVRA